jgi:hypothetical protein
MITITKQPTHPRITIGRSVRPRRSVRKVYTDPRLFKDEYAQWFATQRPKENIGEPDDADGTIDMFDLDPELRAEVRKRDREWLRKHFHAGTFEPRV